MTDNPGRQKDDGNVPPDESKVRTLRGTSFEVLATRVFPNFAAPTPSPGPSARPTVFEVFNPSQSRPGSPLEDGRPTKISRTSSPGEDSDDPISEYTQDVVVPSSVPGEVTLNPDAVQAPSGTPKRARSASMPTASSPLSSPSASPVATELSAPVGAATALSSSPPEGDFTFYAPVIIPGPDNVRTFQGFGPITPTEPTSSGQAALEAHATQDTDSSGGCPPCSRLLVESPESPECLELTPPLGDTSTSSRGVPTSGQPNRASQASETVSRLCYVSAASTRQSGRSTVCTECAVRRTSDLQIDI